MLFLRNWLKNIRENIYKTFYGGFMYCPKLTSKSLIITEKIAKGEISSSDELIRVLQLIAECEYAKSKEEFDKILNEAEEILQKQIKSKEDQGNTLRSLKEEIIATRNLGDLCKFDMKYKIYCSNETEVDKERVYEDVVQCKQKGVSVSSYFNYGLYAGDKSYKEHIFQYLAHARSEDYKKNIANKLADKKSFSEYFSEFLGRKCFCLEDCTEEIFASATEGLSSIVMKPLDEINGKGILVIDLNEITESQRLQMIHLLKNKRYILEEKIKQHDRIAAFHPESINTIRMVTTLYEGNPIITSTILKMGTGDRRIDNFASGGLLVHVDREGFCDRVAYDHTGTEFTAHPDSGITFRNFKIPFWKEICSTVKTAARKADPALFLGWDVTVGNNGQVYIIEVECLC